MHAGGTLSPARRRSCARGDSGRGGGCTTGVHLLRLVVETGGTGLFGTTTWTVGDNIIAQSRLVLGVVALGLGPGARFARGPGTRTVDSQWVFFVVALQAVRVGAAGGVGESSSRRVLILPQVPLRLRSRIGAVTARGRTPMMKW